MSLVTLLAGTTIADLDVLKEQRKAAGISYLQGPGNRRRGTRADSGTSGRRASDGDGNRRAATAGGRRASDPYSE